MKLTDGSYIDSSGIWDNTSQKSLETALSILLADGAGAHNSLYRGMYLGNSVTSDQWAAISAGTFRDLYIGDYWTINGVNWRIAAFDYLINCGHSNPTTHHAVLVPDACLYNTQMNTTATTSGGYVGSAMYKTNLENAKTIIKNAFSGHVLKHSKTLTNNVTNGMASAMAWYDSEIELMCEQMVYGNGVFSPTSIGTTIPTNYRVEKSQLPLFAHNPAAMISTNDWWLRDIVSATCFALVGAPLWGFASYTSARDTFGVRPYFCIY